MHFLNYTYIYHYKFKLFYARQNINVIVAVAQTYRNKYYFLVKLSLKAFSLIHGLFDVTRY